MSDLGYRLNSRSFHHQAMTLGMLFTHVGGASVTKQCNLVKTVPTGTSASDCLERLLSEMAYYVSSGM